ncbi:MAG: helix-turn-helix domain-containing protein [Clostridia bacterium]|nr:helix-turn-helix domain-containing protein [Clostridia bacterium]
MINFYSYNIDLDSAFPISWKKGTAYAAARKYDAISYRVNGSAIYRHGDREYVANKNDLLFIPANFDYSITANKDEDVLVVHFYIENSSFDEITVFTPQNPDAFERIFTEICKVWRTKSTGYRYKMYSLFYKILQQIEIQEEQKAAVLKPKKLQLALDYLHENFDNPQTTIESVASYVGASSVYLRRLFRNAFNKNPLQYLNDMRIEHAISLLKTGYYSIQDVAALSGFNDPKYFSEVYKKKIGHSPSKDLS